MKRWMRNLLVFVAFLCVLTLVVASQSKRLDLFIALGGFGLYLIGSVAVLVKVLRRQSGDRDWRLGWGNQLSALPRSWQRWLLDESDPP